MKRIPVAALSLLLVVLLASCAAPGGTPAPSGQAAAAPASTAGISSGGGATLTIACVDETQQLQYTVTEFEKAYPDVNVQVHDFHQQLVGMKTSGQADFASIIQQLNAEMMSGAGPDIIDTDYLPSYRYANKGLLSDIGALMSGDKSFDRSQYPGNIFDACESSGKLYAVPASFFFSVLCCKAEYSPSAGNATVDQSCKRRRPCPGACLRSPKTTRRNCLWTICRTVTAPS
jgi:multiple sugar transport system substrate-binding protein